jgi:hypothetical protein
LVRLGSILKNQFEIRSDLAVYRKRHPNTLKKFDFVHFLYFPDEFMILIYISLTFQIFLYLFDCIDLNLNTRDVKQCMSGHIILWRKREQCVTIKMLCVFLYLRLHFFISRKCLVLELWSSTNNIGLSLSLIEN